MRLDVQALAERDALRSAAPSNNQRDTPVADKNASQQQQQQQHPSGLQEGTAATRGTGGNGRDTASVKVVNKGVQVEMDGSGVREENALLLEKASAADTLSEEVEGLKASLEVCSVHMAVCCTGAATCDKQCSV